MTTLTKIGIAAAVIAAAFSVVPALKGPCNRLVNTANEKLDDEFVVDNYKAEYVKLNAQKAEVQKNRSKFYAEKRIVERKLEHATAGRDMAKQKLLAVKTSDLAAFNAAKNAYESFKCECENLNAMANVYSNAIAKLDTSLVLIADNMRKAKMNVDVLSSKKVLVDSIKSVNATVSSLQVADGSSMNIAVEKLDETALRESIKLEALAETCSLENAMTETEAKAYLETVK